MEEEYLTRAGSQDFDTKGYKLSNLEDSEFFWEKSRVEFDAVLRRGIDTPNSPTAFKELEKGEGQKAKNPIVLHEEED